MGDQYSSVYLHLPFCETKCQYCDFYSLGKSKTPEGLPKKFIAALLQEIDLYSANLSPSIETIFLGGGTPSMTAVEDHQRIFEKFGYVGECTAEANPSSISKNLLRAWKTLGLNRLSFGVQSLNNERLKWLGRVHDSNDALNALDLTFSSGFTNVSTDLIIGVPGQSLKEIEESLEALCSFPITHLSCYLLTLEKSHRYFKDLPHESVQTEHYEFVSKWMTDRGFLHYEISNFAKSGFECQHNLNYWNRSSYLGFGPSAHSFHALSKTRFKNISSITQYIDKLGKGERPLHWSELLTPEQEKLENWMLAARLSSGFPSTWIETVQQKAKIEMLIEKDLVQRGLRTYHLTPRGWLISDSLVAELA